MINVVMGMICMSDHCISEPTMDNLHHVPAVLQGDSVKTIRQMSLASRVQCDTLHASVIPSW